MSYTCLARWISAERRCKKLKMQMTQDKKFRYIVIRLSFLLNLNLSKSHGESQTNVHITNRIQSIQGVSPFFSSIYRLFRRSVCSILLQSPLISIRGRLNLTDIVKNLIASSKKVTWLWSGSCIVHLCGIHGR